MVTSVATHRAARHKERGTSTVHDPLLLWVRGNHRDAAALTSPIAISVIQIATFDDLENRSGIQMLRKFANWERKYYKEIHMKQGGKKRCRPTLVPSSAAAAAATAEYRSGLAAPPGSSTAVRAATAAGTPPKPAASRRDAPCVPAEPGTASQENPVHRDGKGNLSLEA